MDQIDLAPFTLRFLARVQLLRESTQLFRSAPHMPHDMSYFCGELFFQRLRRAHRGGRGRAHHECHCGTERRPAGVEWSGLTQPCRALLCPREHKVEHNNLLKELTDSSLRP